MTELTVILECSCIKVNGSVLGNVGTAFLDKCIDEIDHALNLFCCLRVNSLFDVEVRHILLNFSDISLGDVGTFNTLLIGFLDDLIVYICIV